MRLSSGEVGIAATTNHKLLSRLQLQDASRLRKAVIAVLAAAATVGLPTLAVNAQQAPAEKETTTETTTDAVASSEEKTEAAQEKPDEAKTESASGGDVTKLSDLTVTEDPLRALSNDPSASSFGFSKPLLETPRSVSYVSEEQLSKFGIQSVQDLTRLVPGTYTTTRYGLQGAINVRTVTADQYYRGMKRLDQQGHVRTVLSAYDNIEVVKGPPSPVFGMGRIGGYTVLDPKSSRARTGKYLDKEQGYFQALTGSYKLGELQFGEGIPFTIAGRASGIYVLGLMENSQSYVKNVGIQQKFFQATTSVDRAIGPFRLETGGQLQNSITSGAYMNRGTQELVDKGVYISGQPMVNLDLNGDGRVGYVESYLASAPTGAISGNNQALTQRFAWRQDAGGNPLPLSDFKNSINGIPLNFKNYLLAHPEINCPLANYMRNSVPVAALGTATSGSLVTRQIPAGYFLNPCTVKKQQVDYRGNGSFERQQNATQRLGYLDLIYDTDPNFTVKQQFFYDSIDSFKDSWLPYGERQYIKAFEDKITVTKRIPDEIMPNWLRVNSLASINYRDTRGFIRDSGGDFDYRQDILYQSGAGNAWEGSGTGGHYPNTMFWTQLTNNSYQSGAPSTEDRYSQYSESGLGVMFDIDLFRKTNLVLGGRTDRVKAQVDTVAVMNPTSTFNWSPTIASGLIAGYLNGTACGDYGQSCPGSITPPSHVDSSQNATSWSASISHELPWGHMRPYVTAASASLALDGSNSLFATGTVQGTTPLVLGSDGVNRGGGGKIIGEATLREVGIKGQFFGGKAQWTLDAFKQTRNDVSSPTDPSVGVEVTSTETKGYEGDFKFAPTKQLYVSTSLVYMKSTYLTGGLATNQEVSGRDLGFQDIVDPATGAVYPAEAFLYGGRTALQLTDPNNLYSDVPGLPNWQGALNVTYQLPKGFGINAGGQYLSSSWANRIKTIKLPQAILYDLGTTYDYRNMHLRLSGFNVGDKRYFQSGQSTNANLLTVMPGRRWQLQLKVDF